MLLYQLTVNRFRNIDRIEMDVHPRFTILHGDNAQGKTNLLEAIHLLGSLKSFRGARNDDLIRKGDEQATISGRCRQQNQVERQLQLDIRRDGKTVRLDNKGVSRPSDYLSCLRSIIFAPEEVGLVKGGPQGRRRLIDRAVFMTRPSYLNDLQEYERLLKQRNRLLKNSGTPAELLPWTEALARSGATIRKERGIYLQAIADGLTQCHHRISQQREA
ncbi:DNA replication/repair protein RecF, partial [Malonomonas rubra]|uniref:DNA replication/repair protein RecF n=1 Tax=Malonomonas rubra TaxID=57040 RepID=UPI0026EFED18